MLVPNGSLFKRRTWGVLTCLIFRGRDDSVKYERTWEAVLREDLL